MNHSIVNGDREDVTDEYHVAFGGIDSTTSECVDWPKLEIRVGDRIEIEILEASVSCPPESRRGHRTSVSDFSRKEYIRSMATEYGWKIIEGDSGSESGVK